MDKNISETCVNTSLASLGKDQINRGKGHNLPEYKKGEVIAGKGYADGAADIKEGGYMLAVVVNMERIDNADKGCDGKDIGKYEAEFVNLAEYDFIAKEVISPVCALRHGRYIYKGQRRNQNKICLPRLPLKERY